MDPRLIGLYERELEHLRGMAGEFAAEYPKIAGRLGLEQFACHDPYVERLLEGVAFLAARTQLKLQAQFPEFSQHLLEVVYPHFLAPVPSMTLVALQPDLAEDSLAEGPVVPRGTALRSILGRRERTSCEYRTAHEVRLWPIELQAAEYLPSTAAVAALDLPEAGRVRSGLRLRLRCTAGVALRDLALDRLPIFLRGAESTPYRLYELIVGNLVGAWLRPIGEAAAPAVRLPDPAVATPGFGDDEALLPVVPRSFSGYRLLQEYFALPERFLFFEPRGMAPLLAQAEGSEIDLVLLFDGADAALERAVDRDDFALFCTPAINLFPKRADRIHVTPHDNRHHLVPDKTRIFDYEVFSVEQVEGYGTAAEPLIEFQPFYGLRHRQGTEPARAFYMVTRERRVLGERERRFGPRSSYPGSELFLSLVDREEAPYRHDLRQLAVTTLCTNRDLPLAVTTGTGDTDFTFDLAAPVRAVRCLVGPTRPRSSRAHGSIAWRLISHLSVNYLSITEEGAKTAAAALRELLTLYAGDDKTTLQQLDGLVGVESRPLVRRMPIAGPIAFGRGVEVTTTLDDRAFDGMTGFLLGAVLNHFFARYATINAFTETVVRTVERGEIMRWPMMLGRRATL